MITRIGSYAPGCVCKDLELLSEREIAEINRYSVLFSVWFQFLLEAGRLEHDIDFTFDDVRRFLESFDGAIGANSRILQHENRVNRILVFKQKSNR